MLWGPLENEEVVKEGRKRETFPEGGCRAARGQWPPGTSKGLLSTSELGPSSPGRMAPLGAPPGVTAATAAHALEGTALTLLVNRGPGHCLPHFPSGGTSN